MRQAAAKTDETQDTKHYIASRQPHAAELIAAVQADSAIDLLSIHQRLAGRPGVQDMPALPDQDTRSPARPPLPAPETYFIKGTTQTARPAGIAAEQETTQPALSKSAGMVAEARDVTSAQPVSDQPPAVELSSQPPAPELHTDLPVWTSAEIADNQPGLQIEKMEEASAQLDDEAEQLVTMTNEFADLAQGDESEQADWIDALIEARQTQIDYEPHVAPTETLISALPDRVSQPLETYLEAAPPQAAVTAEVLIIEMAETAQELQELAQSDEADQADLAKAETRLREQYQKLCLTLEIQFDEAEADRFIRYVSGAAYGAASRLVAASAETDDPDDGDTLGKRLLARKLTVVRTLSGMSLKLEQEIGRLLIRLAAA